MHLIDTHAHLYSKKFDDDRTQAVERALQAGVRHIFLPNIDSESIEPMLALEASHPNTCFAMMGLHPTSVNETVNQELKTVEQWLEKRQFVAVGEMGIDLYWDKTYFEQQKKAFLQQCDWAKDLGLPIAIHCRNAYPETIALLKEAQDGRLRGVLHCFGSTEADAKTLIDLGMLLGIGGVVTFKNSTQPQVISQLSAQHLILETDSPYLAPAPHRGKRNEPAYVPLVAEVVAKALDMPVEQLATTTTQNALELFKNHGIQ